MVGIQDADLVVDELDVGQVRMQLADRVAQGAVEGVDRTVALGRADVAASFDPDLDRRLGLDVAVGALLGDHPEALEPEQRLVLARLAAQQQVERGVGSFVLIAAVLERLDPVDRSLGGIGVEVDTRIAGTRQHRALARELGDQHVAAVADELRVHVLEGARVGLDAGDVHAALVRERVAPDVGLIGVGGRVGQLVDEVRRLGQQSQPVGRDALVAELELKRGQDRHQVGVAAALAVAVDRSLHHPCAGIDRGQRVGDAALEVVVGVDADLGALAELGEHRRRGDRDLRRQARTVGVAERHALGSRRDGRAQALHRVARVVAPGVEEVLGVVDHPLARRAGVVDRVDDHRQVLVRRDPRDLLEVKRPGLADERHARGVAADEVAERGVLLSGDPAPACHSEGADHRVVELDVGEQAEELGLLGVRAREAGLDVADAEAVERLDDADLLGGRERHALALHAVAEGRVVEVYVSQVDAFRIPGIRVNRCAWPIATQPRAAKRSRRS